MSEDKNIEAREDLMSDKIKRVGKNIRITKVVATRSEKGSRGDVFAGYSAAWDSVQNDFGGPGADVMPSSQEDAETAAQGMTLQESAVAMLIVQMQASVSAIDAAYANGHLSDDGYRDKKTAVKNRFGQMILSAAEKI